MGGIEMVGDVRILNKVGLKGFYLSDYLIS